MSTDSKLYPVNWRINTGTIDIPPPVELPDAVEIDGKTGRIIARYTNRKRLSSGIILESYEDLT